MNPSICRQSARLVAREFRRNFQSSSTLAEQKASLAYPLYPSVASLLKEHHVPESEISKIPASGPKGRLLKGDVLSYLKSIPADYASAQSARIAAMGHLDLSNIKLAAPKEKPAPEPAAAAAEPPAELPPQDIEIALPISLAQVLSVQNRIKETLGVTIPLSTFLARATELANEDLPRSKLTKPTADELFDDILGLASVPQTAHGYFVPQISAFSAASDVPSTTTSSTPKTKIDIIDILSGKKEKTKNTKTTATSAPISSKVARSSSAGAVNMFSVTAAPGEEKRAQVFLERVKAILQVEPGRLVL